MSKFVLYLFKKVLRVFDVLLKLLLEILFILFIPFLRLIFKVVSPNKNIICLVKRYQDTIERHNTHSNINFLRTTFLRQGFNKVIVLCVGNGDNSIYDWGEEIMGVNINLFYSTTLQNVLPHFYNSLRDICASIITVRFMKKNQIGFLETDFPSNTVIRIIRLNLISGAKIIVKVIGNMDLIYNQTKFPIFFPFNIKTKIGNFIHKQYDSLVAFIIFNLASLIIGVNRNNFENALSKGAEFNKSFLVRVDFYRQMLKEPILIRKKLKNFPSSGRVILTWSRLYKDMMIDKVLISVSVLLKKNRDLNFVIIGDGPEKDDLVKLASNLGILKQCYFLGFQPRSFIRSAAHYSNVVCLPYSGLSLIEAGIMKCAVVAFDYEWNSELIVDGYSGYLADSRNIEDIKTKLEKLLLHKKISRSMSENLFKMTNNLFSKDSLLRQNNLAYGSLFSDKKNNQKKS